MRTRKFFESTASRLALALGAAGLKRETKLATTRKVNKRKPFGHYIEYVHVPSYVVNLSIRRYHDAQVRMPERHNFLHATKGWRSYARIPQALLATAPQA